LNAWTTAAGSGFSPGFMNLRLVSTNDLLGAAMRKISAAQSTATTPAGFSVKGLLRLNVQRLVVASFRIAHSVSSAATSASAAAATAAISSGDPPRYRSSATVRLNAALPASLARSAACITFAPPNAKPNSASEKSL
jgi:hypothetical protein